MKEELEKLGFYEWFSDIYRIELKEHKIEILDDRIYLIRYGQKMFISIYNHEKLKQLIKLLS